MKFYYNTSFICPYCGATSKGIFISDRTLAFDHEADCPNINKKFKEPTLELEEVKE